MIAILTAVRWNLGVVLICISIMARDDEYFFLILAICTSSFEKVLFSSVAYFFIASFTLGEFSFLSSLYILVISPLSENVFFFLNEGQKICKTDSDQGWIAMGGGRHKEEVKEDEYGGCILYSCMKIEQ
jgi:hypothetical protein